MTTTLHTPGRIVPLLATPAGTNDVALLIDASGRLHPLTVTDGQLIRRNQTPAADDTVQSVVDVIGELTPLPPGLELHDPALDSDWHPVIALARNAHHARPLIWHGVRYQVHAGTPEYRKV